MKTVKLDAALSRMDAERKRAFPSYTLQNLKSWLTDPNVDEATKAKAREEIAAREGGISEAKVTPQTKGGMVIPHIGKLRG